MYVCIYVFMYVRMYLCMYVYTCVCVCVCACVCVCIIHTHTHAHTQAAGNTAGSWQTSTARACGRGHSGDACSADQSHRRLTLRPPPVHRWLVAEVGDGVPW
jgi:hypothetical protein